MQLCITIVCVLTNLQFIIGVLIKFTGCDTAQWECVNGSSDEIIYTCNKNDNESLLYLGDFYADQNTKRIIVQRCAKLKVIADCTSLAKQSQVLQLQVRFCDNLEFVNSINNSEVQTPSEIKIENVKEIVSLPSGLFQTGNTNNKAKCYGKSTPKKIIVRNSKINLIASKAITGEIVKLEFENVTVDEIQHEGIQAKSLANDSIHKISHCNINKLSSSAISVEAIKVVISNSNFGDITVNAINVTTDSILLFKNKFKLIASSGLIFKSINTEISNNNIITLKSNALSNVKCLSKNSRISNFTFLNNKIENVEPYSLYFDYNSCKSAGTFVHIAGNQIDCRCRNIDFLCSSTSNKELYSLILNTLNNNTCLLAPCVLPIDIVKLLSENEMCQLNLDPQVMCLLYNDRSSKIEATTRETRETDTEPSPTLYLIRQANSPKGSAAMTVIDKDNLLKDTHLNMTNRTTIKIVFDSSKDFVETLRSTSSSNRKSAESPKSPAVEVTNRCVGAQCKNKFARDRQKALDFYKYVYAQLRTPKINDKRKKY